MWLITPGGSSVLFWKWWFYSKFLNCTEIVFCVFCTRLLYPVVHTYCTAIIICYTIIMYCSKILIFQPSTFWQGAFFPCDHFPRGIFPGYTFPRRLFSEEIFREGYFQAPVKTWSQEIGMCICTLRIEVFLTREKIYTLFQDMHSYGSNALISTAF